jgi:hypothetical protein
VAALRSLAAARVDFILVGGVAATAHGSPRATQDVDIVYRRGDDNLAALSQIIEGLTKRTETLTGNQQKLRDFYLTAMDEAKLNSQGSRPLTEKLMQIGGIRSADQLPQIVAQFQAAGISPLAGGPPFDPSVLVAELTTLTPAGFLWLATRVVEHREYVLEQ